METPANILHARLSAMEEEAQALSAVTQQCLMERRSAQADYAAGLTGTLSDYHQADRKYLSALKDEQAHREAMALVRQELAGVEVEELKAALRGERDAACGKLAVIEGDAARRVEAAERELRAAYLAQRESWKLARQVREQGRTAGLRLIALEGGPDISRDGLAPLERIKLIERLSPWRLANEDALILPDPLVDVPRDPAGSDYDHARRWSHVLAQVENRLQFLSREQQPQAEKEDDDGEAA